MAGDGRLRVKGTAGYGETAPELLERYESIVFADIHSDILHLIPAAPSRVLDIGAGTGRDAAALAALGHLVVAVEPTAELRVPAQRLHPLPQITWLDDALPDLAVLHERRERFDFILISGVWFHLDAAERKQAMSRVSSLLNRAALLALSLRHGRSRRAGVCSTSRLTRPLRWRAPADWN